MNIDELIRYWTKSAAEDLKTAKSLFSVKRYHHCLFFCHLSIEKILKALIIQRINKPAPYGHNLLRLAELSGIKFSPEDLDILDETTSFNLEARYNDYKFKFYKKADRKYTQRYFKILKEMYLWLKQKL